MHVSQESLSPTQVKLTVSADLATLQAVHQTVLSRLAPTVKVPGFRSGKAPLAMVEKQLDQSALQSEFIDAALNQIYPRALDEQKLRPVAQPEVTISKFVPFSTLEFTATVEVIGDVKLPDYTKFSLKPQEVSVTAKDVNEVLANLQTRIAAKKEVTRAAKDGDELVIDFAGTDAKTHEPISGADGKDYPLQLGSNTFIPGFETNMVGMKAGEDKTFTLEFPKDYGVAALQSRKVSFAVTVNKVQQLDLPKLDDAFAAQAGPFKTLDELKADIKQQLTAERQTQADREYQNQLLDMLADKTKLDVPASLIESEMDRMEQEERQNLAYRGQTWPEHLAAEGVSEEQHRENQRELATKRVRSGIAIGEVAEKEKIKVDPDEVEQQLTSLRAQYTDPEMQSEIDKPETRREITSRLVTEKAIAKLSEYAAAK